MKTMKEYKGFALFGVAMFMISIAVIGLLIHGFVFYKFWQWFIIPTFGLIQITYMQSVGLMICKGLIFRTETNTEADKNKNIDERVGKIIGAACLYPFILMLLGWIVSLSV